MPAHTVGDDHQAQRTIHRKAVFIEGSDPAYVATTDDTDPIPKLLRHIRQPSLTGMNAARRSEWRGLIQLGSYKTVPEYRDKCSLSQGIQRSLTLQGAIERLPTRISCRIMLPHTAKFFNIRAPRPSL
ncbi:hypothetical protein MAIT1_05077 [Magnetofaba australis IT-1]|uniref:Uncharacterized protein n=1 Tax=Magnetofaba australis IT-1 TaxID=1434232 RepID=A0A1Y2K8I7_9PROT|nr:hypothetical protein MAIT1_05077 [Magnetofaba australis IT-1]